MKKRADGRYQKRLSLGVKDGKRIYEYVYGRTIKEVNEKAAEILSLRSRGVVLSRESVTVEQLCQEWLKNEKEGTVKPQTLYQISMTLNKMCEYIGQIKAQELTVYDIEHFRDQMKAKGTPTTYNSALPCLRNVLDYAIRRDILARNVTAGLKRLKYEKVKKRVLSPFELLAIRDANLEVWQRAWIDLLYYTGIRRGELMALTVRDIDFKAKTISINKTIVNRTGEVQNHTKTDAGMRTVMMPDALVGSLRAWCDIIEKGLLFVTTSGIPLRAKSFDCRWDCICHAIFGENVPEDFTPHLFRHTYASNLYKAGVDLKTAQYLLGHSSIKTTMDIYTHFSEVDVDTDKINNFFNSSQIVVKSAEKSLKHAKC